MGNTHAMTVVKAAIGIGTADYLICEKMEQASEQALKKQPNELLDEKVVASIKEIMTLSNINEIVGINATKESIKLIYINAGNPIYERTLNNDNKIYFSHLIIDYSDGTRRYISLSEYIDLVGYKSLMDGLNGTSHKSPIALLFKANPIYAVYINCQHLLNKNMKSTIELINSNNSSKHAKEE